MRYSSSVSPARTRHKWISKLLSEGGSCGNQRWEPDESLRLHSNTTGTDCCTVGYMLLMLSEFCLSWMQYSEGGRASLECQTSLILCWRLVCRLQNPPPMQKSGEHKQLFEPHPDDYTFCNMIIPLQYGIALVMLGFWYEMMAELFTTSPFNTGAAHPRDRCCCHECGILNILGAEAG